VEEEGRGRYGDGETKHGKTVRDKGVKEIRVQRGRIV
jgi:hypothetical protein